MNREIKIHIKNNLVLYIFALIVFCIGIAMGALYSAGISETQANDLGSYISDFFEHFRDKDIEFARIFKNSIISSFGYVFTSFLMSLCVYTVFLVYIILGLRGFSLGFTVGFMVASLGTKGFFFILAAVLPSCIFTLPVYLFMSVTCIKCAVSRHRVRENYRENKRQLKAFIFLMFLIFVVLSLCSLIDTFLSPVLVKYLF